LEDSFNPAQEWAIDPIDIFKEEQIYQQLCSFLYWNLAELLHMRLDSFGLEYSILETQHFPVKVLLDISEQIQHCSA